MGKGSFVQSSFLGGLWGKLAQGRVESPNYKTALDVCENYYPIEQGALLRRQGTRFLSHTRRGNKAKLIPFDFSIIQPYQIEFTNLFARFYKGTSRAYTDPPHSILNISTATPAVVTISDTMDWATGDDVIFELPGPPCRAPELCNRQFTITRLTASTFSIADAMTQDPIDGSTLTNYTFNSGDQTFRILELASPYTTAQIVDRGLHFVQDETTVLFLRTDVKPYLLTEGGTFFTLAAAVFLDGPYLDENTTTTTMTPSGTSGSITVTASSVVGINDGDGFQTTDIGRMIRLRSQAALWNSGTTYAVGDLVTGSDGLIYSSLTASNTNHNPVADITNWAPSAGGIIWNWGKITARSSTTVVTVSLLGTDALLNTTATVHWRLGLWSDTTGWPTCGGYHVGRLWFGGVAGNRFDASKSGDHYNFAPTASDGTVADDNAIAGTFTAQEVNQIQWFLPQDDGLYAGTPAGEWRVKASGLDDPITPASTDARRPTTYKSTPQQALSTPRAMVFTQRQKRKILEFVNQQSTALDGNNLTDRVEQLTTTGIEELVYQQEPTPMLWALRADGFMVGCSYKRTADGAYAGWHQVFLGSERLIESLSVGPDVSTLAEALYLVTADPDDDTAPRFVETLTPMFDSETDDWNAWFVDTGVVPCCADLDVDTITFYGLHALEGKTVCPFIAGVDVGPRVVADGKIEVEYGSDPDGVFTADYLQARSDLDLDYGDYAVDILIAAGNPPGPDVTSPSIMAYIGVSDGPTCSVASVNGQACMPDWEGDSIWFYDAGTTSSDGLRQFLLDDPATNTLCRTRPALTFTEIGANSGGAFALMNDGTLVLVAEAGNSAQLGSVVADGLSGATTFGTAGGSTSPSTASRIRQPRVFCPMTVNSIDYLVSEAQGTDGEVWVKDLTSNTFDTANGVLVGNATGGATSGTILTLCPGPNCAYALAGPNFPGGAANVSGAIKLYRVSPSSLTLIGSLVPSDIDAQWSTWYDVEGLAYDQVDGHLLTQVQTADVGATHKQYVIKINSNTGAMMWKAIVAGIDASADNNMWKSRIKTGTFLLPGGGGVQVINTRTGAVTTTAITGLAAMSGNISDDVSNSVIGFGGYSPGTLTYLGDWMRDQGHHSTSSMFQRVFMGTIAGQDRSSLAADTVYTVGAPIGFCYTSRWKLLRPDYGQDAAAAAGPAFGKKRRVHWFSVLFHRTQKVNIGVDDFNRVRPVKFESPGRTAILPPTLHSGIVSGTVGDNYDFEGQICGTQDTAYPSVIVAVGGYLSTQDK